MMGHFDKKCIMIALEKKLTMVYGHIHNYFASYY